MFSYRHAFHAGNHADVLKHMVLLATLRYLADSKDTPLMLLDTHAGVGGYRLDGATSATSGEAAQGIHKLWQSFAGQMDDAAHTAALPAMLRDYLQLLRQLNPQDKHLAQIEHYPGSPQIMHALLRPQDQCKLFELHPTDTRQLNRKIADWAKSGQFQVQCKDGFSVLKSLLPPPSRRALVLMDPSYELKTDYAAVHTAVADAVQRFATGCYLVWYPVIARPESHELPRRLKTLARQNKRSWLHVTLSIGRGEQDASGRDGLRASGMFLINPPFVLKEQLQAALPVLDKVLRRGAGHGWQLESGE